MRWSENETCQLVKIYLSYDYLWNTKHAYYNVKTQRLKAYREIIAAMKDTTGILLNETELRMKIKALRSTYFQEIAKIKQRSTSTWSYKPNIKWFADWHKCFGESRRGIKRNNHQDCIAELCPDIDTSHNDTNLEEETLDPFSETDDTYLILKNEPNDETHINTDTELRLADSSQRYESKKKKIRDRSPSTDWFTPKSSKESNTDNSLKDDEFDIYGKYIATQLRKMNLQKALEVQLQIQSLVSEARISELNNIKD